jgi:hydrogenase maturation protease
MKLAPAPVLVFGWGNASRGDDALGPLFVERLRAALPADAGVECLDDYQLQPEHVLDLVGRERVLFVDASIDADAPFETMPLEPARDASFSSHAMTPRALLQAYRDVQHEEPPPCTLLAIRGERFELGEAPGEAALASLSDALRWALAWLDEESVPDERYGVAAAGLTQAGV